MAVADLVAQHDQWRVRNIPGPASTSPTRRWKGRNYESDFPTIDESSRRRAKVQGFGFPFNNEAHDVKHATAKNHFPFEAVEVSSVKIKQIPLKLR